MKADASLHAKGLPLRALEDAPASQLALEDFGCTYRERLGAVEREVLRQKRGLPVPGPRVETTEEIPFDGHMLHLRTGCLSMC